MEQNKDIWRNVPPFTKELLIRMAETYWTPLYKYVKKNPHLIETISGFLIKHDILNVFLGKSHIGIEYIGPERINILEEEYKLSVRSFDYSLSEVPLLQRIIGFDFDSTSGLGLPLPPFSSDLIIPTNAGADKLEDLKWNYAAQDSIISFNSACPIVPQKQFTRIVNSFFFHANEKGLITRHIKWLDLIPIEFDDTGIEYDKISFTVEPFKKLVEHDAEFEYPIPDDYKFEKLQKINRFIELTGDGTTTEPEITKWLSREENKFILTMGCGGTEVHYQVVCEWQSEHRNKLIPDFLLVRPNGYADIVEFKLPSLKKGAIIGKTNRESFSAEINSYISQTRCYREYFEDPNNRNWVLKKYGLKIHKPRRILITGRRCDFQNDEWKTIVSDHHDLDIMTYDDLTDMVCAQFYL
jgi:hypothetical protein